MVYRGRLSRLGVGSHGGPAGYEDSAGLCGERLGLGRIR